MTSAADRREILALIEAAVTDGARRAAACAELGLHPRTLERWQDPQGALQEDRRPTAERPVPANRLSEAERQLILETCSLPEFASLPPSQIVPRLVDRGHWIASEASFYRVLRAAGQNHRRGRARRPSKIKPPRSVEAKGPCQVWSWDITWLPGPIAGRFFYLYLLLDIWSRKIVGWEIHERETSEHAAALLERTIWAEHCVTHPIVLHADNGSPMKGATMQATMERLGVTASFSRPRVSNNNPFSEALFRTCKYRPDWPVRGFASLEEARNWVGGFVRWYNSENHHSAIRFVTPEARHRGQDGDILAQRVQVYEAARAGNPHRWSGRTRNWQPIGSVWLNPERPDPRGDHHGADDALTHKAGGGGPMGGDEKRAA
jgi:putative transposase